MGGEARWVSRTPAANLYVTRKYLKAARETVGQPVNPGRLWTTHLQDSQAQSSNSYCTAQARSAVFKHKNPVHFNDYKTYNGSTTATNARRRGSDTLAITPTPRSGGWGTGHGWSRWTYTVCGFESIALHLPYRQCTSIAESWTSSPAICKLQRTRASPQYFPRSSV